MPTRSRIPLRDGQESVRDYPRPPRLERVEQRIRVLTGGVTIADTQKAYRVLETSHPPVYSVPPDDVRMDLLERADGSSFCEFKGRAISFDVTLPSRAGPGGRGMRAAPIAWAYNAPSPAFAPIEAFPMVGPFNGGPGTHGW